MAKAKTSNSKSKATQDAGIDLVLPEVTRISGDADTMLEQTIAKRYSSILLVLTGESDIKKNVPVLTHAPDTKDANSQVSTWNKELGHMLRLTQAMINGWAAGSGLSGDGSCKYVLDNADKATKSVPNFLKYDIYLLSSGRTGASQYRISVPEMIKQLKARGQVISDCVKSFGIATSKKRTKKSSSVPQVIAHL